MKINLKRLLRGLALPVAAIAFGLMSDSCRDLWSEDHPGTYYTNNGETIADYLEGKLESHGEYSHFIAILEKANLWGQMRTYGTYTCFAPDDAAMEAYIKARYDEADSLGNDELKKKFTSLETVLQDKSICDTIARTHIFNNLMFASDLNGSGVLQHPNMLDRYVAYNSYADSVKMRDDDGNIIKAADGSDSITIKLRYLMNMQASVLRADDTVQNGVVHQIDKVLRSSNQFVPGLMQENPNLTIFYQALVATHLKDSLEMYYDDNYPEIEYEWTEQALRDNYAGIHHNKTSVEDDRIAMPEKREFKFTMFAMPDTALANYNDQYTAKAGLDGIHSLNDLRKYAAVAYPDGADIEDETNRYNSLNQLLSYHILPCWLSYDQFNTSQKDITKNHHIWLDFDIEDFFETMQPHSVMRISTPAKTADTPLGIFINRKGTIKNGLEFEGTRIAETANEYNLPNGITTICVNGGYHYINKLLVYDEETRTQALQCRMRIMCCTLSPDFINSRGRGRLNGDPSNGGNENLNRMVYAYKLGFCKNFEWVEDQTRFYVRYRDKTFGTFNGDEITVRGSYDLAFRLPPVPSDGNYEIRVWNNANTGVGNDRGICQFYFHQGEPDDHSTYWRNWNWIPEDIPVDLRITGNDPRIGMVLDNDSRYDALTEEEKALAIDANDRAMRNRGYMQAIDSYFSNNGSNPLRLDGNKNCYRKIVCNEYLRANQDYYIRMRQVFEDDGVFPFSFIEIVPKSVYEGNEDKH